MGVAVGLWGWKKSVWRGMQAGAGRVGGMTLGLYSSRMRASFGDDMVVAAPGPNRPVLIIEFPFCRLVQAGSAQSRPMRRRPRYG